MMQQIRKLFFAVALLTIVLMGITASDTRVSAQDATGSFNPQTQFQAGSRMTIRSAYGIALLRFPNQTGTGQQSHWNQTQQNLPTYSASITIDAQLTGDAGNGGVQFVIQGGVIVVNTSTIAITGGKGEVSNIDRVIMEGTAASADGQSFNWHMNGLAAVVSGALICELTGNVDVTLNGASANLIVTYIATMS
jgi:hypothetical protein